MILSTCACKDQRNFRGNDENRGSCFDEIYAGNGAAALKGVEVVNACFIEAGKS